MRSASKVDVIYGDMERIVSKEYLSTAIFDRIKTALDPFPYELEKEQIPYIVVMPGSKEEISEIVKYANTSKIPLFLRGSGTHLAGAARPYTHGIFINMHRFNKMEFLEDYGFFECGSGCICAQVQEELEKRDYFLPMSPGSRLSATMGGLIANNTSTHIIDTSIGKPGDYVYGLEVVLPNGEIIETGTMGLRRPAGTDLTKFFLGGDGLLGIITKIRMRLLPSVQKAYGVAVFDNLGSLAKGVQRMYRERRPPPLFMEFMDQKSATIGYEIKEMKPPEGPVVFFVSIGNTEEEASNKTLQILRSFQAERPIEASEVDDLDMWDKLWSAGEVIGSFLMQKDGSQMSVAEVVSTLKNLPECMEEVQHFNRGLPILGQLELYLFGHIGALALHPGVLIPRQWDNEKKRKAIKERFQREAELNLKYGTCGGEWGQFSKRTSFFIQRYGRVSYDLIKGLKNVFDPNNILNPGVLEGYG
ncbi:MAG: FAD-binding oxidoreductase [Deltaproteobacteria bacterium]|nr:FAD-binding oxidoreductase [Deltaproteobacteria bacterium]MBW2120752.1 FAD-binding oxidoreductase [Deltaproteobacteria bacterium]